MRMTITEHLAKLRLDKVLTELLPDASLRHRRRLIETGAALVDGQPARPGTRLRAGQVVSLRHEEPVGIPAGVALLHREGEYAAVTKPGGVHSATIRGGGQKSQASVEAALPLLFPEEHPQLLNRLDQATSGFVLVAFGPDGVARFRSMEAEGRVRKEYIAKVSGHMEQRAVIRNRLDTAGRKRVRVLEEPDPDPTRHTHVQPVSHDALADCTLVQAIIARGARHQIRAHLAALGHAIIGDALYGEGEGELFLHHRAISFAGFATELEPGWD